MKNTLLLLCLVIAPALLWSQQVNTQIGRVTTQFDYKDSKGARLENLVDGNGFHYAAGYRHNLSTRVHLNLDGIYNIYTSSGSDPTFGNSFSWRTEYLGLSTGLEFEFWKNKGYSVLARGDINPQVMMKGTQSINDQSISLKGVEQFDKPYLFYRGGIGMNFCAETDLAISLKYMYGIGRPMGSDPDGESMSMITHTISLGVLWSFRSCTYCYSKRYR